VERKPALSDQSAMADRPLPVESQFSARIHSRFGFAAEAGVDHAIVVGPPFAIVGAVEVASPMPVGRRLLREAEHSRPQVEQREWKRIVEPGEKMVLALHE